MSNLHQEANDRLRSIVGLFAAKNARQYTARFITSKLSEGAYGFQFDPKPFEGTLIDIQDAFLIYKTGRADFRLVDRAILESSYVPAIGEKILCTPYHRRAFDGRLLGDPVVTERGQGYSVTSYTIGESISKLPIDKATLQSEYLKDMIKQVEEMKMPDGIRTIAQALIDYGALEQNVTYVDPTDENIIATPPSLTFSARTEKFTGAIRISYDRACDTYVVETLNSDGSTAEKVDGNLTCFCLGDAILRLLDDGLWRYAKVQVLSKAKKKAA